MNALDPGNVVLEGTIRGVFTGFAESNRHEPYPVFEFTTGERFEQAEPCPYDTGCMTQPPARIIQRGEDIYLQIMQAPREPCPRAPWPVRVRQRRQADRSEPRSANSPAA